ncbi:MAG: transcriptional regulator, AraC family [Paenibacillaceae bacterium]|jgi:AraC-like DNA-binding protein|nr:transcriptional regulator, AraC family [Paenibacillaceae bacterium]
MRYYRQMLFAFTLIAVVYTLLIEGIFLTGYYLNRKAEYSRTVEATAQQLAGYTDSRVRAIQEIHMLLQASEYTANYLAEIPGEPNPMARLKLHTFLSSLFGIAPTQLNSIAVTKLTDDYAILNDSTGDLSLLRSKLHLNERELADIRQWFAATPGTALRFWPSVGDDGAAYYVLASRHWLGRTQPLYVFASFSVGQLFQVQSMEGGSYVMLQDNEAAAIIGEPLTRRQQEELLLDSIQAGRVDIPSASLDNLRFIYLAKPPQTASPMLISIIGIGLLALLAACALMVWISKRMYTPIQSVLQASGGMIAKGDEIAYVRNAFHMLHENIAEISSSMEAYKSDAEGRFFRELLLGMLSPSEMKDNLQRYRVPEAAGPVFSVLIKYVANPELAVDYTHNLILEIKPKLTAALRTLFEPGKWCVITDMSFETQVMIIADDDTEKLAEMLRNTLLSFEPEFGLELKAIIGSSCREVESISTSYQDALTVSGFNEFSPQSGEVITRKMPHAIWNGTAYYPINLEQSLTNAIIHGKTMVWRTILDEILEINRNGKNASLLQLTVMLGGTVSRIANGLYAEAGSVCEGDSPSFTEFRTARSFEELGVKAAEVFAELSDRIRRKSEQSSHGIAARMEEYISLHYHEDISLFDLAEHLNLSMTYVSTLFKAVTGHNFKDYLNEYRFKTACRIISEQPDKKVKEIAELVGCNTAILTRLFVRYTGMTPGQYLKEKQS